MLKANENKQLFETLEAIEAQYKAAQATANEAHQEHQAAGSRFLQDRKGRPVVFGEITRSPAVATLEKAEKALQTANAEVIRLGKIRDNLRRTADQLQRV